jgi:phage shock protein C
MMETKRILRSRDDRVIAGVASGLARYFNTDPLFVRLGFVLLAFFQGFGVLLYLVLWLLLPNEGSQTVETREQVRENVNEMRGAVENLVDRVRGKFNS